MSLCSDSKNDALSAPSLPAFGSHAHTPINPPPLTFTLPPLGTPIKQVCDKKARSANYTNLTPLNVTVHPLPHHFYSSGPVTFVSPTVFNGLCRHRVSPSAPIYPSNITDVRTNNIELNRTTLTFNPKNGVDVSSLSSHNYLASGTHHNWKCLIAMLHATSWEKKRGMD